MEEGMMKERIERVAERKVHIVETNEYLYTRHSADDWSIRLGESDEAYYDYEMIEISFQRWVKENSTDRNKIEWDETPIEPNEDCRYTHIKGLTNSHFYYQVEWKSWKESPVYVLYIFSNEWSSLNEYLDIDDTLDGIKRIAENHYLSILEPVNH
jgi:hypothetical protein